MEVGYYLTLDGKLRDFDRFRWQADPQYFIAVKFANDGGNGSYFTFVHNVECLSRDCLSFKKVLPHICDDCQITYIILI